MQLTSVHPTSLRSLDMTIQVIWQRHWSSKAEPSKCIQCVLQIHLTFDKEKHFDSYFCSSVKQIKGIHALTPPSMDM